MDFLKTFVCDKCGGMFNETEIEQVFIDDNIGYEDTCPYCGSSHFTEAIDAYDEQF